MHLHVSGREMQLCQVGRDFLILQEPCVIPSSTHAEIVIEVDDQVSRRQIVLVDGITAGQERVNFT